MPQSATFIAKGSSRKHLGYLFSTQGAQNVKTNALGLNVQILWFTYPGNVNALTSPISFGTSGISLSFLLTVIGAGIARARGRVPEGKFALGRWGWPVIIVAEAYLLVMFINMVARTGLSSPRGAAFNLDWITLVVMVIVFIVGVVLFALSGMSHAVAAGWRPRGRRLPVVPGALERRGVSRVRSGTSRF